MWRVSASSHPDHISPVSPSTESGFRIFICFVLVIGIIHGMLIISTLHRYGAKMDEAWRHRVEKYIATPTTLPPPLPLPPLHSLRPIYPPLIQSIPYSSLESDTTPYLGPATSTNVGGPPATQITSNPRPQPPTTIIPTDTEPERIHRLPPFEFSTTRTLSPAEWKSSSSHPIPTSSLATDKENGELAPLGNAASS